MYSEEDFQIIGTESPFKTLGFHIHEKASKYTLNIQDKSYLLKSVVPIYPLWSSLLLGNLQRFNPSYVASLDLDLDLDVYVAGPNLVYIATGERCDPVNYMSRIRAALKLLALSARTTLSLKEFQSIMVLGKYDLLYCSVLHCIRLKHFELFVT